MFIQLIIWKVSDWNLRTQEYWKDFHNQWWGAAGRSRLAAAARLAAGGTIITVEQQRVCDILLRFNFTQGQLYVRSEYELMYQRLCNAHRAVGKPGFDQVPGVLLSGQPGIGAFARVFTGRALTYFIRQGSRILAYTLCFGAWLKNSPSSSFQGLASLSMFMRVASTRDRPQMSTL